MLGCVSEFSAGLGLIDRVSPVVSSPVGDKGFEAIGRLAFRSRGIGVSPVETLNLGESAVDLGADGVDDDQVGELSATADIICFTRLAVNEAGLDPAAVVVYVNPVAHVQPIAVYWKSSPMESI